MSWRDRPYSGDEGEPEIRLRLPKPGTVVTWIIVANVVVYLFDLVAQRWDHMGLMPFFGLSLQGIRDLYLWQPFTYMFMHGGLLHLVFNMLMLYFFGTEFQRAFGRERFLQFYAICGVFGGLAYLVLSTLMPKFAGVPLVGASGAVYGLLAAAIIFFPHMQVVLLIFPIPVRVFGLIVAAILLLQILSPQGLQNPGGEVCHVAGALAGVLTFYAWGVMPRVRFGDGTARMNRAQGAWARRQRQLAEEKAEVDRILQKIHDEGLNSLTRREKKILAEATRHQREREQEIGRIDRL